MISIIAVTTPIMLSGLVSINTFEELPPLPNDILVPQSLPVFPLVIEVFDDPEVDELLSEVPEATVSVSGSSLQVSSVHTACSSRPQ